MYFIRCSLVGQYTQREIVLPPFISFPQAYVLCRAGVFPRSTAVRFIWRKLFLGTFSQFVTKQSRTKRQATLRYASGDEIKGVKIFAEYISGIAVFCKFNHVNKPHLKL